MGDRGQVYIKDNKVYLYTHSSAYNLLETVEKAIAKQWRWDDPDYLTRIIFDEMTKNSHGEETGYGIGTQRAGDIWRLIEVDCKKQTVEDKKETDWSEKDGSTWKLQSKKTFAEIANAKPQTDT